MGYIKVRVPKQSDEEITTAFLCEQHPSSHPPPPPPHPLSNNNNYNSSSSAFTSPILNHNRIPLLLSPQNLIINPSSSSSSSSSCSSIIPNSSTTTIMTSSHDPENNNPSNGNSNQSSVVIPETAHPTSTDSWLQAGFVLTTGINSAYVLGYAGAIMVPLGWIPGVLGLLFATGISLFANALVAQLHEYGGKRHIRYRELAGFIYGPKTYSLTWALQYINLFMINTGFIILAGSSIKAAYTLFNDDHALKLPYCIIISGFLCALFAIGIPHLSALRIWLGISTFFGLIYILIAIALSLKDGIESPPRDYSTPREELKVFKTIGAAANLVFAFNTGMLPEIQATVRKPVVENMMKALYFQFTVGVVPMYAIVFIAYWAYGNKTEAYLLSSVHGPVWLKAIANISAFLQTIVALHIFASPMYEYLDTRFGISGSALHPKNLGSRVLIRGGYLVINTFVAALLPFLGDFMSLTGAISTFPLTFILANHMYFKAKRNKLSLPMKIWLWINIVFFTAMAATSFVAALRLIATDSKEYHLFADL